MKPENIAIVLFALFAFGLPIVGMQTNLYDKTSVHGCTGACYEQWKGETGGVLAVAQAKASAKANASPAELGKATYAGCAACHGAGGEGGVGPTLNGQTATTITDKLMRYKNGETIGAQSNLMWAQASQLSTHDIDNLAAFIETL
jgi:cytochrome c553